MELGIVIALLGGAVYAYLFYRALKKHLSVFIGMAAYINEPYEEPSSSVEYYTAKENEDGNRVIGVKPKSLLNECRDERNKTDEKQNSSSS